MPSNIGEFQGRMASVGSGWMRRVCHPHRFMALGLPLSHFFWSGSGFATGFHECRECFAPFAPVMFGPRLMCDALRYPWGIWCNQCNRVTVPSSPAAAAGMKTVGLPEATRLWGRAGVKASNGVMISFNKKCLVIVEDSLEKNVRDFFLIPLLDSS